MDPCALTTPENVVPIDTESVSYETGGKKTGVPKSIDTDILPSSAVRNGSGLV